MLSHFHGYLIIRLYNSAKIVGCKLENLPSILPQVTSIYSNPLICQTQNRLSVKFFHKHCFITFICQGKDNQTAQFMSDVHLIPNTNVITEN